MICSASVVLPCYNGARWISLAIESILAQTCKNFELVIIDDGSTDNSKKIIARYLSDERVRYVYQDSRGFSAAINRGIQSSVGPLIGFIGQDDLWVPNKLELQLEYLSKRKDVGLVCSNYYSVDSEERIICNVRKSVPAFSPRQEVITRLFLNNFIAFETVLVKRECFDEVGFFDERMVGFSDHDMWLRLAGKFNIGHLGLSLVKKREHELRISNVRIESVAQDEFLLVLKALARYPFLKSVERKKMASLYHTLGLRLLQKGNIKEGRQKLLKAINCQPLKLKTIGAYMAPTLYAFILHNYQRLHL